MNNKRNNRILKFGVLEIGQIGGILVEKLNIAHGVVFFGVVDHRQGKINPHNPAISYNFV